MGKNNKYAPIIENHVKREEFNFQKNNCSLVFTLRIDIPDELRDYHALLLKAADSLDQVLIEKFPKEKKK